MLRDWPGQCVPGTDASDGQFCTAGSKRFFARRTARKVAFGKFSQRHALATPPSRPSGSKSRAMSRCDQTRILVGPSFSPTSDNRNSINSARPRLLTLSRHCMNLRNQYRSSGPRANQHRPDLPETESGWEKSPGPSGVTSGPCRRGHHRQHAVSLYWPLPRKVAAP